MLYGGLIRLNMRDYGYLALIKKLSLICLQTILIS